jgi:alkanesulfonate monooxygenase SsuD/methylene tetrahydromethanopterin reductase-like flavin-dependent oxidoreductase (luciferase family)
LREQWKNYAQAATAAGRTAHPADWAVARNVFVADSTDDARRIVKSNSLAKCIQYILDLTRATAPNGIAMWKRDDRQADSDCTLDYFMNDVIIAGDPAHVTARLLELREQIGPFGTLILTAHDWDDRDQWARSLELFAREVVPAFNKAIRAQSSAPSQTWSFP